MDEASGARRAGFPWSSPARSWLGLAGLALLGLLGNYLRLPILFGVDFLFGSIAAMVAVRLYGPLWGGLAALAAASYTYAIWNHPYAAIVFTLEAVVVGLLLRRRTLVAADFLFWLALGIPLVWLFYGLVLRLDAPLVWLTAFKQAVNGVFNALVAGLILDYSPLRRLRGGGLGGRLLSFRELLFNLLVALVFLPTLVLLVLNGRRDFAAIEEDAGARLRAAGLRAAADVELWHGQHLGAVEGFAAALAGSPLEPSARLQREVELFARALPGAATFYVANPAGTTVAFSPRVNARGQATVGLSFADRPYVRTLRETLRPVTSDVFLARGGLFGPTVTVSAPVLEGGRLQGFVSAALDLGALGALARRDAEGGTPVTVVDGENRVVASSRPGSQPLEPLLASGYTAVRLPSGLEHRLPVDDGRTVPAVRWQRSTYALETPVSGLPWTAVVEAPVAPYQRELQTDQRATLGVLFGLAGVLVLLAGPLSRRLTEPLAGLAAVTSDLPRKLLGRQDIGWPRAGVREVAVLIANFKAMVASLNASLRELETANAEVRALNADLERRVGERTRELEERNLEAEAFIYTVSHDLRSPLLSINGMADLLAEAVERGDAEEARFLLGRVTRNTEKMGELLNDLLALSRVGRAGEAPAPLDLGETARGVAAELEVRRAARGARLELPADWPFVLMPPSEAYQLLANLVGNAMKWAGREGEAPRVRLGWSLENGMVTVRVSDNGRGVPPEYRARVFELFKKLDPSAEGTGVGLAIVKRIAERHSGRAWVEDSPPPPEGLGGAVFAVTLPAAGEPAPEARRSPALAVD